MTDDTRQRAKRRPPRVLKGFRDYLPRQMILRQRIIQTVREIFERHGFEPLDTPALEYLEVLTGKAGENEKLMYQFEDQGGREVGLRYDLTVPLARVVAMHQNDIVMPFKRYHIAPVWRAEKPQRGRFREFWQCDADIAGSASMVADAEIISMIAEVLTAFGLPNFTVLISHRRLLSGLAQSAGVPLDLAGTIYRSVDKLTKIGVEGVQREMADHGIEAGAAQRVLDAVTIEGPPNEVLDQLRDHHSAIPSVAEAVEDLHELFALLPEFGVPATAYRLDLSLARGLDYYTGPVYEAVVVEPKVGSVAGAGRYDDLVGSFLGRPVPATGMSIGLERIIEVVEQFDLLPVPSTVAEAVVIVAPETIGQGAGVAARLRAVGVNVDFSLQARRSFGDQLKYAGRKGIPVAVIIGSAELDQGLATVKDLASGVQESFQLDDLADRVKSALGRSVS
ncbi:MAG: histidine--tRNA ligase [Thermomicrobiales bacterium]